MVVDGTEQQIVSSVDKAISKLSHSGKKATNTVTKVVGVSPQGKLMWLTRSFRGAESDISLCKMTTNKVDKYLSKEECVAGDKGFIGLEKFGQIVKLSLPSKSKLDR